MADALSGNDFAQVLAAMEKANQARMIPGSQTPIDSAPVVAAQVANPAQGMLQHLPGAMTQNPVQAPQLQLPGALQTGPAMGAPGSMDPRMAAAYQQLMMGAR